MKTAKGKLGEIWTTASGGRHERGGLNDDGVRAVSK